MNHFYISSMSGSSGISKYAAVFYDLVLKPRGYIHIDSTENLTTIFTKVSSVDRIHIEIGIFQKREIQILLLMIRANYKNISITLHDAPLLKFPLKSFENRFLNMVSKFYDRFICRFHNSRSMIGKISAIYVLTEKGLSRCKRLYKTDNFIYLPHIVDTRKNGTEEIPNRNFLYLGFIGRNKGIEYALKLHERIIKQHPDIHFYIIGKALGRQINFYHYLKTKYIQNVHFLGYVEDQDLVHIYGITKFAILMFRDYKFYIPVSGSILNCMNQKKIILTSPVNAIPEIIEEGKNGFFLTGVLQRDQSRINDLLENSDLQKSVTESASAYLRAEHNKTKVCRHFFRDEMKIISADSYQ